MTSIVLPLLLAAAPWSTMGDAQRADAMHALQQLPTLRERLVAATDGFLGTPYVLSPLGEGSGPDPDPLIRWDAVDCVTMLEQSVALSIATPETLVSKLTELRYDGTPTWAHRLHLMEAQWIPVNVKRGWLRDVTADFGGKSTRHVSKVITAASWDQKSGRGLNLTHDEQPVGTFPLTIIPAEEAAQKLRQAPTGLVVVVVRADRPHLITRVSHVGVLVQGPDGPMLRHASRSFKRVVDEPLRRYLSRNLDFGSWTIEGLAIFEPRLPASADGGLP